MDSNTPSKTRPRTYYLGAAALVLAGLTIGLGLSAGFNFQRASTAQKSSSGIFAPSVNSSALPESPFSSVVEKALPAVVFIDVRKKVSGDDSTDPQDEIMRRFFGGDPQARRPQTRPSSGSGFIIDSEGHILTNNHVVRDASDITVTLSDKRTFKARVVGSDAGTDVAVIKIDGSNLPSLPLGDSDRIRVGDWAIAIGNPLGVLRGSVTVGIISAQGRSNLNIFGGTPDFQDFIQTDASINFGNSGGPLCNIRGEAIGINTAINPSGQGIGFAIPINLVKHVAEQLVAHGQVKRAWLGVQLADLTPEIAEGFGLANTQQGVVIQSVLDGTPASKAGLKRNDVVIEFDGQPVSDMQKFRLRVADTPSGKRVPVTVLRDGRRETAYVTLADRDEQVAAQTGRTPQPQGDAEPASAGFAGLKVRALTAEEKAGAKVQSGVLVTSVDEGSAADDAGIQQGDIIEEVNRKPMASPAVFTQQLKEIKAAKKHAVLLVHSGQNTAFVPLTLDEK
jgi:Do/DeqQ family serine protease